MEGRRESWVVGVGWRKLSGECRVKGVVWRDCGGWSRVVGV